MQDGWLGFYILGAVFVIVVCLFGYGATHP